MNAQRLGLKCMLCWCLSSKVGFWGLQVLLLVMSVTYGNAWAARSRDASKPIEIAADSVEIDEGRNTSTYTGKVEVQQGSMRLLADHVVVQHQPSRQPGRIAATGSPVHYQQSEADGQQVKAEAKRMEYNILRQEILLSGAARLNRSQDSFHSDRIIYYRNKGIIKAGSSAAGKQRVRISIAPQEMRETPP